MKVEPMAKRTVVTTIDDIDGSEGADTIEFGLDGLAYAIDLSKTNADALRDALSPFVNHARKVSDRATGSSATGRKRVTAGSSSKAVRRWAAANGIDVPASGRVPKTVVAEWKSAGSPA